MTPCDNCIENECEVNGYVCPLYKKYQESEEAEKMNNKEALNEALDHAIKALEKCSKNAQGDLISRSALKESMRKSINERYISWTKTITVADIATLIFDEIEYAPTVELDESVIQAVLNKRCMTAVANEYLIALHDKRPHGKWIKHIDNLYPEDSTEECPFCHEEQRLVGNDDNFCPNCGADMRGKENDK